MVNTTQAEWVRSVDNVNCLHGKKIGCFDESMFSKLRYNVIHLTLAEAQSKDKGDLKISFTGPLQSTALSVCYGAATACGCIG